jgi:eukaryotic-like serine/threonine-protein kinase
MSVDPRLGRTIAGKYQVLALLGAGGMGRVYRATHAELGEDVAIKFLLDHWASMPEFRARFRREAVALARLRHPNIVSVLDFGEDGAELFMVMELVRGVPLTRLFEDDSPPLFRKLAVFEQILQVLEAAHSIGIVHRDLKPDNVLVRTSEDRVDRIKVLDFGLAYLRESEGTPRLTETGIARGTPDYMSPEQCRGRDVGAPSDVYSAGVMLFELVTRRLPFPSEDFATSMAAHLFADPPRMSDAGPKEPVPEGLEALVHRALAKAPEARPTAREMRDAVSALLHGTDEHSLAEQAGDARIRAMSVSRSERALTTPREAPSSEDVTAGDKPIVLWMGDAGQAGAVRLALAVNGIKAEVWSGGAVPGVSPPPGVIVVTAEPDGGARTCAVRGAPGLADVPVLVVAAGSASRVTDLIRAGASDVVRGDAAPDVLAKRVRRLLRRGR